MSIEIMNAVWRESRSDGRARLVLLAIADHQGEIGAWPSIATLAKMVNASERSVKRDIQELQKLGELKVELQNAPTTRQYKTNRYWVTLPSVAAGVTNATSGVTAQVSRGDTVGTQNLIEPLLETNTPKADIQELFDEFWNSYPRKLDKAKAFRAFKSALTRAKFEEILAGVIAYRNDPKRNPDYTKYPATWLNNDSWENAAAAPDLVYRERREKEVAATQEFLKTEQELAAKAAPPPKCQHGNTVALCKHCLKKLS